MAGGFVLGANLKFNRGLRQGIGLTNYLQALGTGLERYGEGRRTTVRVFPHDSALLRTAITSETGTFQAFPSIQVGAQDIHPKEDGSFTRAPFSASDLIEMEVRNVLIGHSETRVYFGVTDADVANKLAAALRAQIFPTVCIGEDIQAREVGEGVAAIGKQIRDGVVAGLKAAEVEDTNTPSFDIVYEPVWAIAGFAKLLGKNPGKAENTDIVAACFNIREVLLSGGYPKIAEAIHVGYGGSANANNAEELLRLEGVDALLVGTAAWDVGSFLQMIEAAEQAAG